MSTAAAAPRRSFRDVVAQGSCSRIEPPYKVGELVYATVRVESPMSAFRLSCRGKLKKKERRLADQEAKTRRGNEESGEIKGSRARPCVILSTQQLTRNTQLPADEKRLALPVYQGGGQRNDCEVETGIPAFVFQPLLKPRAYSYIIGYPITRSGSCIQRVIGDDKPVMDLGEVRRLKEHCDWIRDRKRGVFKPQPLPCDRDRRSRGLSILTMPSGRMAMVQSQGSSSLQHESNFGPIQRVDSPVSYLPRGSIGAGPVPGPSGVSRSDEEPSAQQVPKRKSGSGASQILEQFLNSAGNFIKRAQSAVSSLGSRSSRSK